MLQIGLGAGLAGMEEVICAVPDVPPG